MRHYLDLVRLAEARRNPDQNPKIYALDALMKYADRDDIYVSFTHDVGTESHVVADRGSIAPKPRNASGAKLGINPRSTYFTPTGIYGYPVDYVIHLMKDGHKVPFGSDRPFIWVMQVTGKVLDTDEYGDLMSDIPKINAYVHQNVTSGTPSDYGYDVKTAIEEAHFQTPAGQFWNVTRVAAIAVAHSKLHRKAYDAWEASEPAFDDESDDPDFDEISQWQASKMIHWQDNRPQARDISKETINERASREWRRLMMHLGYEGVVDREGIIHSSEPIQGVFFSKASVRAVELIRNVSMKTDMEKWKKSPSAFMYYLRKGLVSTRDAQSYLSQVGNDFRKIPFDELPEEIKAWARQRFYLFVPFVDTTTPYGLSDDETINVLSRNRPAITKVEHLGPKAKAWVKSEWKRMYSYHFDEHPEYAISAIRLIMTPLDVVNYVVRHAMVEGDDHGWRTLIKNARLLNAVELDELRDRAESLVEAGDAPDWLLTSLP